MERALLWGLWLCGVRSVDMSASVKVQGQCQVLYQEEQRALGLEMDGRPWTSFPDTLSFLRLSLNKEH